MDIQQPNSQVEAQLPVAQITEDNQQSVVPKKPFNAVQVVIQWLCYTLWTWASICVGILLSASLGYYLTHNGSSGYSFVTYTIVPLLVITPLAFGAEILYCRREPQQKHGFEAVIMVLHAVSNFLLMVGSIIGSLIALASIIISDGSVRVKLTIIISAFVVGLLATLLFLRVLHFDKLRVFNKWFRWVMLGVVLVSILLAAVGPVASEFRGRSDRPLETGLQEVNTEIGEYARTNNKLPSSLSDLTFSRDYTPAETKEAAKKLISNNQIEYTPTTKDDYSDSKYNAKELKSGPTYNTTSKQYSYSLCVVYKQQKGDVSEPAISRYNSGKPTTDYISTYQHPAGRKCYNLQTYGY